MKQYLRNLWLALTGADPFADEVADLKGRLERAGENVRGLNEMYYSACERWEAAERQTKSLQTLVENLRQRIREKDAQLAEQGREFRDRMEQMKADYQRRIKEYNEKLEQINNDLKMSEQIKR